MRGPMLKHVDHPPPTSPALFTGPLEFECRVLHVAETGQRLIAYCAAPGSATGAAFAELAARARSRPYGKADRVGIPGTVRVLSTAGTCRGGHIWRGQGVNKVRCRATRGTIGGTTTRNAGGQ
jgi:hypothetical protein